MFGGSYNDNSSLFYNNFGTFGGTLSCIQISYARICNSIFINQSAFTAGLEQLSILVCLKFWIGGSFSITDNAVFYIFNSSFTVSSIYKYYL